MWREVSVGKFGSAVFVILVEFYEYIWHRTPRARRVVGMRNSQSVEEDVRGVIIRVTSRAAPGFYV